ncbi:MAG: hypothetical protein ACLPKW_07140 [Acetobacteraceae bacterium]
MSNINFGDIAGGIGDFGTAVGDIFASQGSTEAASSFGQAAQLEEQNAQIAKASGNIQLAQQQRAVYTSESGTRADVAGAGLKMGGSAAAVLRSSASQGALGGALISAQTQANVLGYQAQANAYEGQQSEEEALSKAQSAGGIMSAISGVVGIAAAFF